MSLFATLANKVLRRKQLLKLSTSFHITAYRLSKGWFGGLICGLPNLLLTTTGRRSGLPRTTPLFFLYDKHRFVVVASYGGNPNEPLWWKNLQADPSARVQIGDQSFEVVAHKAEESLKEELWPVFARHYPSYDDYQERAGRNIPLVILTPV